ncbi:MAG: hypothetical protein N2663_01400 [Chlorobi bacterium]|nr:hypothetical protein [Chlorobiota bacterium]
MTAKQILVLVLASTITFLAILAGGGYLYRTNPGLLGLPVSASQDGTAQPPKVWEVELEHLTVQVQQARQHAEHLNDSLRQLSERVMALDIQNRQLQQQLVEARHTAEQLRRSAQRDSLRLKNLHVLAEMYDRADPAEVAKILAGADNSYAAAVLRLMKRKTAARVIEHLPKDKALAVSLAALDQH